MKTIHLAFIFLLLTACGLPKQFPRTPEDLERKRKDSHAFCRTPPCMALVTHSTLDVPYIDAAQKNHVRYAKKYNLDYEFRNNLISDFAHGQFIDDRAAKKVFQLGLYWQKLIAVKDALNKKDNDHHRYDWVWWIDSDAIFTNFSISPSDIIKTYGKNIDFIASKDPFTALNSGAFLVRNNESSRQMINDIINLYPYYKNEALPEQSAMSDYVLGFVYKNHFGDFLFTPEVDRNYARPPMNKIAIISQRAINSFYRGGLSSLAWGPQVVWEPGDFIAHFAAVKEDKNEAMRNLLKCFEEKCGQQYENDSACLEQCS